jgi:RsiW-degrading membrane proteinase PrsW (M82 family)
MTRMRSWTWVVVLVVGLALYLLVRRATVQTGNPNFVPSLILLGAAVAPVTFLTFMAGRRIGYGVGGDVIALTALVGGVVGVVTAGVLEFDTLRDLGVVPMIAVGVIEEAAKLITPVVLLLTLRERRVADGLLIGVASGAGFAVLETMGYAFVALIKSQGDLSVVDDVLFFRGVLSPAAHMAWTGITCAALWAAAEHGPHLRAYLRFVGVFVVAVALHTTWDSIGSFVGYILLAAISLALLTYTAHHATRDTARIPVITPPRALSRGV